MKAMPRVVVKTPCLQYEQQICTLIFWEVPHNNCAVIGGNDKIKRLSRNDEREEKIIGYKRCACRMASKEIIFSENFWDILMFKYLPFDDC
uniref:Uncharacterized protein n=1 Tax=Onchocerca volvulus TaxID=6282 RepID=A0A8R1TLV5_ONCVO